MIPNFKELAEGVDHGWGDTEKNLRAMYVAGLRESIGLMFMVKNEIYDGENPMTKKLCVKLEYAILDHIKEIAP